jgi:hypothetical protein
MLETFTLQTFAPCVGEPFRLRLGPEETLDLALIEATDLGGGLATATATAAVPPRGSTRRPFSLVFRGPPGVLLPQRVYRLEHDGIGAFELFLVPIGPDAAGMRYEAVFT